MENLIEQHIAAASDHGRPATLIADNESPVAPPTRGAPASAPPAPARAPHTIMAANDTGEGDDSDADETDNAPPKPVPAPAKPFVAPKAAPVVAVAEPVTRPQPSTLDTPAAHGWVKGPMGVAAKNETAKGETATAKEKSETRVARDEPVAAHSGWFIQIGASDDAGKVGELLQRAKTQGKGALASAKPFTEKVVKDGDTIYRARFALADSDSAETACKALKRGGFPCFTAHVD